MYELGGLRVAKPNDVGRKAQISFRAVQERKNARIQSEKQSQKKGTKMYEYKATVENVVDGDTVDLAVDLGFKVSTRQRVRLARIDTPERSQPGYAAARDFVREAVLNKPVMLKTAKVSKWGYYLAEVTLEDGRNLSDTLVQAQLARYYDGGKK